MLTLAISRAMIFMFFSPAMRKFSKVSGLALFCVVVSAGSSKAVPVFIFNPATSAYTRSSAGYTVGNQFQVGSTSITINSLGAQLLGSTAALDVGLWDSSGNLLTSASVSNTGLLSDGYRYANLNTSITLASSSTYYLGAYLPSGAEFLDGNDNTGINYNSQPFSGNGVSITDTRYIFGGSLAFPGLGGGGLAGRWAPANATFIAPPPPAPVPGPLPIFGATLGYAWSRRLRSRIKSSLGQPASLK